MSNSSTALDTVLSGVVATRGYAIQDKNVFADYLAHGGMYLNEAGRYEYDSIEYNPTIDDLNKHAKLVSQRDNGMKLYRLGDMEFIATSDSSVVTRYEDPALASYFPIHI